MTNRDMDTKTMIPRAASAVRNCGYNDTIIYRPMIHPHTSFRLTGCMICFLLLMLCATSCREDELVVPAEYDPVPAVSDSEGRIRGMYLLNEGNMGSNKCTLDYLDYVTGLYARNIYPERNPNVIKELGDVGNDIAIYGSKLYIVVNCSHKVEVLDAKTAVRIAQIDIPNCRYIKFHRGKAYVSSYVGPVLIDPDSPKGAVYEVDTTSLKVTGRCIVGYQPEEMEIIDDYMYVANSGGYRVPNYDNTVSVIQLIDFKQVRQIPVAINLHRIRKDRYGRLWVTSRGDYNSVPPRLYYLERDEGSGEMRVAGCLDIAVSDMAIRDDSMYYIGVAWSNFTGTNTISYGIINVRDRQRVADNFITDGTEQNIKMPYGISVHPVTGDIYVTDAKNYVSSGTLYCFSPDGKRQWSVRTGDIPAHICFYEKR